MPVRRATAADLPQLAVLFDAYRQFYEQPPDLALATKFLAMRLAADQAVILVADDGTIRGFTLLYPMFSSIGCARTWVLNDLFVAADARRMGLGEALLDAARAHGIATGAQSLSLMTSHRNAAAQRLYEKAGWKRDAEYWTYELPLPYSRPAPTPVPRPRRPGT
jgi:ribosomal protein S18 acetylase RimI-like enzyme